LKNRRLSPKTDLRAQQHQRPREGKGGRVGESLNVDGKAKRRNHRCRFTNEANTKISTVSVGNVKEKRKRTRKRADGIS